MHLPKCSRKLPYSLRSISPITRSVSILMRAACELVCLPFRIAGAATASFVKSRRDRARLVIGMRDLQQWKRLHQLYGCPRTVVNRKESVQSKLGWQKVFERLEKLLNKRNGRIA